MEDKDIYKAPVEEYRKKPMQIFLKQRSYAACVRAGRKTLNEQKA
jgi:hypothetical protein